MLADTAAYINFSAIQHILGWLAVFSVCTFSLSLVLIPWLVGNLPQDYFIRVSKENKKLQSTLSPIDIIITLFRNVLGFLLLLAGIAMLFLPGQGLLTILLGSLLLSFPGKEKLINHLIANNKIQRTMDWLREKRGKESFSWPG